MAVLNLIFILLFIFFVILLIVLDFVILAATLDFLATPLVHLVALCFLVIIRRETLDSLDIIRLAELMVLLVRGRRHIIVLLVLLLVVVN